MAGGTSIFGQTLLEKAPEQQGQISSTVDPNANTVQSGLSSLGLTGNTNADPFVSVAPSPTTPPNFSGLPNPVPAVPPPSSPFSAVPTTPPMQGAVTQPSTQINVAPPPMAGPAPAPPQGKGKATPATTVDEEITVNVNPPAGGGLSTLPVAPAAPTKNPPTFPSSFPTTPFGQMTANVVPSPAPIPPSFQAAPPQPPPFLPLQATE